VDNVDNFVEKCYLQPPLSVALSEKRDKKELLERDGEKIRKIYVNRLSTKKSTRLLPG